MKLNVNFGKSFLILFITLFLSTSSSVMAQGLSEWTWDEYGVGFSVPSDFKVQKNTSEEFMASNSAMNLTIYPRLNENLNYNSMKSALETWARSSNVTYSGRAAYMEDLNGYWGVYIDGASNSYPVTLLLLVDPDFPENSMYIWLSYSQAYQSVAVDILLSFNPIPINTQNTVSNSGLVQWTWDQYSTAFAVPSDFKVQTNTSEEFMASNSAMNLTIYPRMHENLNYNAMQNALTTWARSSNVAYSGRAEYMEDLNGYWGVFIEGTSNGYPVLLLLAVDPDYPETSLYIWLSYSQTYQSVAEQIIMSFTPN